MKEYLNETVFCKLAPSPIDGIGVFAIRDIPKGQQLTDCYGTNPHPFPYTVENFDGLVPEVAELIKQRTEFRPDKPLTFLSPNYFQIFQAYMNNSDTPNSDGRVALRDIKKGEEITENYKSL